MTSADINRTIETVWRMEAAKLIAGLARIVRDVGLAEELAQDALVAALQRWPQTGMPDRPGAWLMATAKHRAVDRIRRDHRQVEKYEQIAGELVATLDPARDVAQLETELDDAIGDDLLRLIFTACHPVLSTEARVALTLRVLGGLSTTEIARSFLVGESAMGQRIVRAKRTLTEKKVGFEAPAAAELPQRLASVLEVIYLIFNEGYSATSGDDWMRPELCGDALRLGRTLAELMPQQAEVHGLVALMEIQASRIRARIDADGEPILLLDQDRSKWDQLLIRRGFLAMLRAEKVGGEPGPYVLQAAIAVCHARAKTAEDTDWRKIASLYAQLAHVQPSPVVELNRAVAVGMAFGPQAGLDLIDELLELPALHNYHLLPSVRGDLLAKLGRHAEAQAEFERASDLARNTRERHLLHSRITGLSP